MPPKQAAQPADDCSPRGIKRRNIILAALGLAASAGASGLTLEELRARLKRERGTAASAPAPAPAGTPAPAGQGFGDIGREMGAQDARDVLRGSDYANGRIPKEEQFRGSTPPPAVVVAVERDAARYKYSLGTADVSTDKSFSNPDVQAAYDAMKKTYAPDLRTGFYLNNARPGSVPGQDIRERKMLENMSEPDRAQLLANLVLHIRSTASGDGRDSQNFIAALARIHPQIANIEYRWKMGNETRTGDLGQFLRSPIKRDSKTASAQPQRDVVLDLTESNYQEFLQNTPALNGRTAAR